MTNDDKLAAIEAYNENPRNPHAVERSEVRWLIAEVRRLTEAINTHRSQKADDRCIEDDDRLYEALGDGIKCDRRVGDKAAMLANCQRFIEKRCEGGGWPSYAELEAEVQAEYARGRADERRDVIKFLRDNTKWKSFDAIERGEHVAEGKDGK